MKDHLEIIAAFNEYIDCIDVLIEHFASLNITTPQLYEVYSSDIEMGKDENNREFVQAMNIRNIEPGTGIFLQLLKARLMPFYRNSVDTFTPRLIGTVILNGSSSELELAKDSLIELNRKKANWGDKLKEHFPNMKARQTYLARTPEFRGLCTKSIHRSLPVAPTGIYASKLSWSQKSVKSKVIDFTDEVLTDVYKTFHPLATDSEIQDALKRANKCHSGSNRYVTVMRTPIRVHPVQTVYYKDKNEVRQRTSIRPGLPLIVFGSCAIRCNHISSYDINDKLRQPSNKKYQYHPIWPVEGVFERYE